MTVFLTALTRETVPLGTGLPTQEELIVYYPGKFTWRQLKTFVNSGDLGLLKRDRTLQKRYDDWAVGIREQHGTLVNYLVNHRLQWGKPDTLSLRPSALDEEDRCEYALRLQGSGSSNSTSTSTNSADVQPCFTHDASPEHVSIIQNDWPYSVPIEIEHTLIWTRLPIFHPSVVHPAVAARIEQDGLCGFTGLLDDATGLPTDVPPSPSLLPTYLPTLGEWGITRVDQLVRSNKGTEEEEELVKKAGWEVNEFVKRRWKEDRWETAWFVNPPRLQSVLGLAHIHVFAKEKKILPN